MTIQLTLNSLNDHKSLWQKYFGYYDHGKKQETNGFTISCFFLWHTVTCMPGQLGYTFNKILEHAFKYLQALQNDCRMDVFRKSF